MRGRGYCPTLYFRSLGPRYQTLPLPGQYVRGPVYLSPGRCYAESVGETFSTGVDTGRRNFQKGSLSSVHTSFSVCRF